MTINRLSEKFMIERFYNIRCLVMFITAVVCYLLIIYDTIAHLYLVL